MKVWVSPLDNALTAALKNRFTPLTARLSPLLEKAWPAARCKNLVDPGAENSQPAWLSRKSLFGYLQAPRLPQKKKFLTRCLSLRPHGFGRRQQRGQEAAGMAFRGSGDVFRGAGGDDAAAAVAAFGAQVDDVVGGFDDFEVMLDDDHRVAGIDQRVQDFEEFADVLEMQAGGGLVQDVDGAAGRGAWRVPC